MKAIKCCIPGCTVSGVTVHRFPNLKKYRQQFNHWLDVIGLQSLKDMDPESVYQNKRICFAHFDPTFKSRGNPRLHRYAVPSLGLPGVAVQNLADNPVLPEIQDLPEIPESSIAVINSATDTKPSTSSTPARLESPVSQRGN